MSTQDFNPIDGEPNIYRHKEDETKLKVRVNRMHPTEDRRVPRERTLPGATIEQARQVRQELIANIKALAVDREGTTTVTDLVESFVKTKKKMKGSKGWSKTTLDDRLGVLSNKILDPIGHFPVDRIDRDLIRSWIEWAEDQRLDAEPTEEDPYADFPAQSTYDHWWKVLKQVVNHAYLEGYIEKRLVDWASEQCGPVSPVERRRETGTLSVAQLHAMVDTAEQVVPARAAEIATLAFTGMRRGTAYGLEWRDVDWEEDLLRLERAYTKGVLKNEPKTGRRTVPMIARLKTTLREHRDRLDDDPDPRDIVFPSTNGTRRRGQTVVEPCRHAANATSEVDQRVTPQVFRRSVNSRLAERETETVVWSVMGHSSKEMTQHYSELHNDRKHETMATLARGNA